MQPTDSVMKPARRRVGRGRNAAYWALALLVMLVAAGYQRRTGPTYPVKGELRVDGQARHYELLTSHVTSADAPVAVPAPGGSPPGTLFYRRYPTNDEFTPVPLHVRNGDAVATLPVQPEAGKLEYYLRLETNAGLVRIPADPNHNVIIRFKGHVPIAVLLPHVLLMFLSMLVGVRAAFAALFRTGDTRALGWTTLGGMTLGGMILGPLVQKAAFGALWTGVPFGWDLTDNKTLLMWLAWLVACLVPELKGLARTRRGLVLAASVVMLVVYLIPHSLAGSQLDYQQLPEGMAAQHLVGRHRRPAAATGAPHARTNVTGRRRVVSAGNGRVRPLAG